MIGIGLIAIGAVLMALGLDAAEIGPKIVFGIFGAMFGAVGVTLVDQR